MWCVFGSPFSSPYTLPSPSFSQSFDHACHLPPLQIQTLPISSSLSLHCSSPWGSTSSDFNFRPPSCSLNSFISSSTSFSHLPRSSRIPVASSAQSFLLCSSSERCCSPLCVSDFAAAHACIERPVRWGSAPTFYTQHRDNFYRSQDCKLKCQRVAASAVQDSSKLASMGLKGGAHVENEWERSVGFTKPACKRNLPYKHGRKARSITVRSILQWNRRPQLAGQIPRVVVVTSGKGGVGKTTTTANIGLCLARLEFKVVAIDADVGLRNLDLLLGLENRVNYTAMEVLNGDCRLDQALVRDKRWTNLELLCINKPRYKMPLGFGGKALTWLVDALKKRPEGSPDFVLIDCPAGIDAGFITAITPANEAVLVTTPDITSLRDADRVTGLLECDGIKDIKMMVNRVRSDMIKGEDMMSVLDVQEMLGLPLLGVIPEDAEVIRSTNRGYPLVLNKPPTLAGLAFEQAAWRLVEQDSMKAVLVEQTPAKKGFLPFMG